MVLATEKEVKVHGTWLSVVQVAHLVDTRSVMFLKMTRPISGGMGGHSQRLKLMRIQQQLYPVKEKDLQCLLTQW